MRRLLTHQKYALEWARSRDRIALFMQMRLGKTLVAIRWAEEQCPTGNKLVVCPLSASYGWLRELGLEEQLAVFLYGDRKERMMRLVHGVNRGIKWFITNPQSLYHTVKGEKLSVAKRASFISTMLWDVVIIDESVLLKNPKSVINKICHYAFEPIKFRCIMSGEPAPQGPQDYFEQMRWLDGKQFMGCENYWQFMDKWFQPNFNGWGYAPVLKNLPLIRRAVKENAFVLTRDQAGMGNRRVVERRWVDLPQKVRQVYKTAEKELQLGEYLHTKFMVVQRNWLRQIAGGYPPDKKLHSPHKVDELVDLLTGDLLHEKVVVLFSFNDEMDAAARALARAGIRGRALSGKDDITVRNQTCDEFRQGKFRVLLLQIKIATYGVDLSAADTMVRYSLPYSFNEISQSMERIESVQKNHPLLFVDLCCKDTIDEDVLDAMQEHNMNARMFEGAVLNNLQRRVDRLREEVDA